MSRNIHVAEGLHLRVGIDPNQRQLLSESIKIEVQPLHACAARVHALYRLSDRIEQ